MVSCLSHIIEIFVSEKHWMCSSHAVCAVVFWTRNAKDEKITSFAVNLDCWLNS